jgi:hypothetical protein
LPLRLGQLACLTRQLRHSTSALCIGLMGRPLESQLWQQRTRLPAQHVPIDGVARVEANVRLVFPTHLHTRALGVIGQLVVHQAGDHYRNLRGTILNRDRASTLWLAHFCIALENGIDRGASPSHVNTAS